jgi:glucose-1-phosphate adenylyltransferase
MPFASDTVAVVLAGGVGSRLAPLTQDRTKPAVPFGGQYRIIDFTLSNCLHSGLRRILLLTQYKSHSLQKHLRDAWSIFNPQLGEYITAVPPQLRTGESWYQGTADAIYQNLFMLKRSGAKFVVVLSGDHIYRMNYEEMLTAHRESGVDVTVGCMEVALKEAQSFGVMSTDINRRIVSFQEKPQCPTPTPHNPDRALASMGIYVFSIDVLCRELESDAANSRSSHDFGKDLLPRMIHTHKVFGHRFGEEEQCTSQSSYWRDVGTIDAYYQANMDLLKDRPPLDFYSECWPIRKHERPAPPARIDRDSFGTPGIVADSLISNGVIVSGGTVNRSILSTNVRVGSRATVDDSILFDDVVVGEGVQLKNCIVDKGVRIPAGESVGITPSIDAQRFTISDNGVVVIPKGYEFVPLPTRATSRRTDHPEPTPQRKLASTS